jgi:hypothetical protein
LDAIGWNCEKQMSLESFFTWYIKPPEDHQWKNKS